MVLTLLERAALGWVLGHLAATLVRRRARRRGICVDADELSERWGLAFACGVLVFVTISEII